MKPSKHETTHEEKELIGQTSIFEMVAIDRIIIEQESNPIEEPADVDPVQLPTIPEVSSNDIGSLESPAYEIDQSEKQSEMAPIALVFLDEPLARRLAVAWVSCHGIENKWLDAAGIQHGLYAEANRLTIALRMNGICRDGGVTDILALRYITSIVAGKLTKKGKPTK